MEQWERIKLALGDPQEDCISIFFVGFIVIYFDLSRVSSARMQEEESTCA